MEEKEKEKQLPSWNRRGSPKGRVVVRSKWLSLNLPPRRCATPLIVQNK